MYLNLRQYHSIFMKELRKIMKISKREERSVLFKSAIKCWAYVASVIYECRMNILLWGNYTDRRKLKYLGKIRSPTYRGCNVRPAICHLNKGKAMPQSEYPVARMRIIAGTSRLLISIVTQVSVTFRRVFSNTCISTSCSSLSVIYHSLSWIKMLFTHLWESCQLLGIHIMKV